MVSPKELRARITGLLRFSKQELSGLVLAILVTAFVFSFRDWGEEQFSLAVGLTSLFLVFLVAAFSFFFRIACQKIYALSRGYKAEFKVWWAGLLIALVVAFISLGRVPLVLAGTVVAAFMTRQRVGEMRYGFSLSENAVIAVWGILGNLIAAILFAVGLYFYPESYFFGKGLWLNLIMAFFALLPIPQLDGLQIYFGSRLWYYVSIALVLLAGLLLLSKTKIGLIAAIVVGVVMGIVYILIGSEK